MRDKLESNEPGEAYNPDESEKIDSNVGAQDKLKKGHFSDISLITRDK